MSQSGFGFVLPCRASNIRGQLKHTYLTNKICLKTLPEDLVSSLHFKEKGIPQHQVIRNLIIELLEVMETLDKGFSPAQLVDKLTSFRVLPVEKREEFKKSIHLQFTVEFRLVERSAQVKQISDAFIDALDKFLSICDNDLELAQSAMDRVQESARSLICVLESLPKGIFLWARLNYEGIKLPDHAK